MTHIRWYIGNSLAGYLDFCAGVFIAAACAVHFGKAPSLLLLLWGITMALLPDLFDLAWPVLRGHVKKGYDHRATLAHMPLAMFAGLSIIFIFAALIGMASAAWILTGYLALLWHYLHDTPDGVMWLWPVSGKKFFKPGPALAHDAWLEMTWCTFSYRGIAEVALGTMLLFAASVIAPAWSPLLLTVGIGTFATAVLFWSLHARRKNLA